MHDWEHVTSVANFRLAEQTAVPAGREDRSKDCQVKRAVNEHDAGASNEGRRP
jgi:hypothetical protein